MLMEGEAPPWGNDYQHLTGRWNKLHLAAVEVHSAKTSRQRNTALTGDQKVSISGEMKVNARHWRSFFPIEPHKSVVRMLNKFMYIEQISPLMLQD